MSLNLILDPKIFNYIIIILYVLNSMRWFIYGSIADSCYWLSAMFITVTVTFLNKH